MALASSAVLVSLILAGVRRTHGYRPRPDRQVAARRPPGDDAFDVSDLGYVSTFDIIEEYEHDQHAFTQGLAFDPNGNLYESDGLYQRSGVRKVDIASGQSLISRPNDPHVFGEGLEYVDDTLVQAALCAPFAARATARSSASARGADLVEGAGGARVQPRPHAEAAAGAHPDRCRGLGADVQRLEPAAHRLAPPAVPRGAVHVQGAGIA